jgi:hypothetical protein
MARVAVRLGWVLIAIALRSGSFAGGDTSILTGLLFLLWTMPFDLIWWRYLNDLAEPVFGSTAAQAAEVAFAISAAYAFWFVLVPRLFSWARSRVAKGGAHAL